SKPRCATCRAAYDRESTAPYDRLVARRRPGPCGTARRKRFAPRLFVTLRLFGVLPMPIPARCVGALPVRSTSVGANEVTCGATSDARRPASGARTSAGVSAVARAVGLASILAAALLLES